MSKDPVVPDEFIATWLTSTSPSPRYTRFEHQPLTEQIESREKVLPALARVVFLHHNDPQDYRQDIKALGYPGAAQAVDRRPRTANTRMGNFGEIVASEYLHQMLDYDIPIYRLRYNPNPESSMKGDDVLAFKFGNEDGSDREILVGESKAHQQFSRKAVEKAYHQLVEASRRPHPISLTFVVGMLRREGQPKKADSVLAYLNQFLPHKPRKRWLLFLVTGTRPSDPFGCLQERDSVVDNLIAVDVRIEDLAALVNSLFEQEISPDEL